MSEENTLFIARLKHGPLEFPSDRVDRVIDNRVVRVVGTRREMQESGVYGKPFMCYNAAQERHHRYASPYEAIRAILRAGNYEGISADDIPDGDKQRVQAIMAKHGTLKLLLVKGGMTDDELERFEKMCVRLAKSMGRPVNQIKQEILTMTLEIGTVTNLDVRSELLNEVVQLDTSRLDEIAAIGNSINWRRALIIAEIVDQQKLERLVASEFAVLLGRHDEIRGDLHACADQVDRILEFRKQLDGLKDRPFIGLARKSRDDIDEYVLVMREGPFNSARKSLEAAVVAHDCFSYRAQVHRVLYMLAALQPYRGPKREERLERVKQELLRIRNDMNPERGDILSANPLESAYGHLNDALHVLLSGKCDLDDVKNSLRKVTA